MILSIPYKALSKCNLEELAAQQVFNDRRAAIGGVAFARKEDGEGKRAARQAIADLMNLQAQPEHISVLTMPGHGWYFEGKLLKLREPNWRNQQMTTKVSFTCVENDRYVYYSATTRMPGKHTLLRTLERPEYAERAMGNGIVGRYEFANVDDLMRSGAVFDFAWLDYTGPLNLVRMKTVKAFWLQSVRNTLIVTVLKARWNKETGAVIARHGGCIGWLRASLPGTVVHEIEYQDGASPMAQFAVSKTFVPKE